MVRRREKKIKYNEYEYLGRKIRYYEGVGFVSLVTGKKIYKSQSAIERAVRKHHASVFSDIEAYISKKSSLMKGPVR